MRNKLVENRYGTGAIPNKVDLRDKKWGRLAKAVTPFDWEKGYDVEEELAKHLNKPDFKIPVKDQNGSFSCVGQSAAYYESVHDAFEKGVFTEKSARDAYSQIFYPGGGSSIRSAVSLMVKKGICKESLMPSYLVGGYPPDEVFVTKRHDASDETRTDALSARGTAYADVKINIDTLAQAIKFNKGLIFVVEGEDNGTWRSKFPRPPAFEVEWAHAIYAGKAKLINGKKHIGILNSWSANTGDRGWQWLNEEYINKTFSRDAMVVYDTENDVLKQKIAWYQQILELLQKLLLGTNTK